MAKAKLNPILEQLHGGMGDLVFRRTPGGGVTVMHRPDMSKVAWSPAQAAGRERFRRAVQYARSTLADPQKRIPYDEVARKKSRRAYGLMLADFINPPVIHSLEWRDGQVRITAGDTVCVAQVRVKLLDADGAVLEQGLARQLNELEWEYAPSLPRVDGCRVMVEVENLAGNVTRMERE